MTYHRQVSLALLAGAVAGALVLGIAGRAATAGVAFVTGNALNLSLRGVLEGVIVGTLVGAVGGVLLIALRRVHGDSGRVRGITLGAILFVCSSLVAWGSGKVVLGSSIIPLFTLGAVGIMFLAYGVCADAFLTRFERGGRKNGANRPH